MKNLIFLAFLLLSFNGHAQLTGKIDYKPIGISFTIPAGWQGAESEYGLLLGHHTKPGMVLMLPNEASSMEDIRQAANENLNEGNGTFFSPSGSIDYISDNMIGRHFEGTMEWEAAKAYVVGAYNSKGASVTIMAVTTKALFDQSYRALATEIAKSIQFADAVVPQAVKEWQIKLVGRKLTAMDSSSSESSSTVYDADGNATTYNEGSYQSSKTSFGLCPSGYFYYYSSNSASFDTAAASGMAQGKSKGDGQWKVISDAWGNALLVLTFKNGNVSEYKLTSKDDKTYLNGNRYFKTSGEYGPDCN